MRYLLVARDVDSNEPPLEDAYAYVTVDDGNDRGFGLNTYVTEDANPVLRLLAHVLEDADALPHGDECLFADRYELIDVESVEDVDCGFAELTVTLLDESGEHATCELMFPGWLNEGALNGVKTALHLLAASIDDDDEEAVDVE